MTMTTLERRRNNRLFKCFKPHEDTSYLRTSGDLSDEDDQDDDIRWKRKFRQQQHHHSFSGTIKAVLFKTSLVKKLRSKKKSVKFHPYQSSYNNSSPPSSNKQSLSSLLKRIPSYRTMSEPEGSSTIFRTSWSCSSSSSSLSPLFSSSASASSGSSCLSEVMIDESAFLDSKRSAKHGDDIARKVMRNVRRCARSKYSLMYILFVSLLAFVLGGKGFAVFTCTTALCLCFAH